MKNKKFFLILLIISATILVLTMFSPLFSDDYNYYLIFGTQEPIVSIKDIMISQYNHYFMNNGRFVPHFFVQLFDGIMGKGAFNAMNALLFVAFLWLLSSMNKIVTVEKIVLVFFILILLLPGFNNTILWLSGSCNYLWTAVFILVFHRFLVKEHIKKIYYPFLFLYGVFSGWTNEAIVVGLCAAYFFFFIINRRKLKKHRLFLLSGFYLGVSFLLLSPGSINRFFKGNGDFSVSIFLHQLLSSLIDMSNLRILPLLLVLLIAAICFKKINRQFFYDNSVWIIAIIVSFVFVLLTRHTAPHSRFGIELFSLILLLELSVLIKIPKSVVAVCAIVSVLIVCQTIYYSYLNYQEYNYCVSQIKDGKSDIVETNEVVFPSFFDRLILRFMPAENDDYYFSKNEWIERYFGAHDILFLPQRFMERLRIDEKSFEEFEMDNDLPFYAKHMDDGVHISKVIFHLSKVDLTSIPFFFHPIANKMERYTATQVETEKYDIISLPQGRFLLVYKNHMIDNRVLSIELKYD